MTVVIFDLDDTLYNMDTLSALPESNIVNQLEKLDNL